MKTRNENLHVRDWELIKKFMKADCNEIELLELVTRHKQILTENINLLSNNEFLTGYIKSTQKHI